MDPCRADRQCSGGIDRVVQGVVSRLIVSQQVQVAQIASLIGLPMVL